MRAFCNSPCSIPSDKEMTSYPRDPRLLLDGIDKGASGSGQSVDGEALVHTAGFRHTKS